MDSDNIYVECDICFEFILKGNKDNHIINCQKEQIEMFNKFNSEKFNSEKFNSDKLRLTVLQDNAIKYAEKKSKIISKNVYLMILAKFKFLGYTEDNLRDTIKYIQLKVPVVIHLNLDKTLQYLCNDTEYRNQFETQTSGGILSSESRLQWEKVLFNGIYDKSEGHDKVKYGALNITNSNGIKSCYSYGDSYLILKDDIKKRITFVHGDSSGQDLHIVTYEYPVPILSFLSDGELKDVIDIAIGRKDSAQSHMYYIEAQIHGPIRLNKDIEKLMVNERHRDNLNIIKMLDNFSIKNNFGYEFF